MLLETLRCRVGCLYLSDLKTEPYNRRARLEALAARLFVLRRQRGVA